MRVKAPSDVVEYIRSKFWLNNGEVVKNDWSIPSFAVVNRRNYSMSYVKDVLEGKDPDLSVLVDVIDGELHRSQDPVWSIYKGKKVSDNGSSICGVKVFNTGVIKEILERPVFKKMEPKHIELKRDTLALEPLVASECERWCIKDRFRLKEGEVVHFRGDKPFGDYTSINNMRYSKGYVQQVLENKNPDVSDLFELREGVVCRSQDPIWGLNKGKRVKYTKVCGTVFAIEGYVMPEQRPTEEYELLD